MNMINKEKLLPRNKLDEERALNLFNLDENIIIALLPDLFYWTKDSNWHITDIIYPLLVKHSKYLIPYIKDVFNGSDSEWIYNCLRFISINFNNEQIHNFREQLDRFANNPTSAEIDSEVNMEAIELLEKIKD